MYDGGKIIFGLLVFLIVITFPIWFPLARGESGAPPQLQLPARGQCVIADPEEMRAGHMQLLNRWRDEVVRGGERFFVHAGTGRRMEKSLSHTCLVECHQSKAAFCDRCHEYTDVHPYCWDCHVDPTRGGE